MSTSKSNEMSSSGVDVNDAQVPVVPPIKAPDAAADAETLQRVESTLDRVEAAQESVGQLDEVPDAGAQARTTLDVSVVIPVYNEHATVAEVVRRIQATGVHRQIFIVDDGSTDTTRIELDRLAGQPDVHVYVHHQNRGKGAALRTALKHATGEVVIIQDADLEYDPADYPRLLAPIERGEADVVYGSRYLENARQDTSRWHRFGNWLLTAASNLTTGRRLTDMETCYKVFRTAAIRGMTLRENRFGIEPELTAKLTRRGARIVEVPIRYHGRGHDEGKKIGWRDGVRALWCIFRYAWWD